jgi:hypothetical protein
MEAAGSDHNTNTLHPKKAASFLLPVGQAATTTIAAALSESLQLLYKVQQEAAGTFNTIPGMVL